MLPELISCLADPAYRACTEYPPNSEPAGVKQHSAKDDAIPSTPWRYEKKIQIRKYKFQDPTTPGPQSQLRVGKESFK